MLLTFHISNTIFMFEDKNSLLALTGAQEMILRLFVDFKHIYYRISQSERSERRVI